MTMTGVFRVEIHARTLAALLADEMVRRQAPTTPVSVLWHYEAGLFDRGRLDYLLSVAPTYGVTLMHAVPARGWLVRRGAVRAVGSWVDVARYVRRWQQVAD